MMILFSPQVNTDNTLTYEFSGDKITATVDGIQDEFDFSGLHNGVASEISTSLTINPVLNAERVNGVLYVELLNFIGNEATDFEKFPNWIEVV